MDLFDTAINDRPWWQRGLGADPVSVASEAIDLKGEILLSTFMDRTGEKTSDTLDLRGNEGVLTGAPLPAAN